MFGLDAYRLHATYGLCCGKQGRTFRYGDSRILHFPMRLLVITPISKKADAALRNDQDASASSESAEITNVRQMSHDERVEAAGRDPRPKALLTALEVHSLIVRDRNIASGDVRMRKSTRRGTPQRPSR